METLLANPDVLVQSEIYVNENTPELGILLDDRSEIVESIRQRFGEGFVEMSPEFIREKYGMVGNLLVNIMQKEGYYEGLISDQNSQLTNDIFTTIAEDPLSEAFQVYNYRIYHKEFDMVLNMIQSALEGNVGESREYYEYKFMNDLVQARGTNNGKFFMEYSPTATNKSKYQHMDKNGTVRFWTLRYDEQGRPYEDVYQLWFDELQPEQWAKVLGLEDSSTIRKDIDIMKYSGEISGEGLNLVLSYLEGQRGVRLDQDSIRNIKEIQSYFNTEIKRNINPLLVKAVDLLKQGEDVSHLVRQIEAQQYQMQFALKLKLSEDYNKQVDNIHTFGLSYDDFSNRSLEDQVQFLIENGQVLKSCNNTMSFNNSVTTAPNLSGMNPEFNFLGKEAINTFKGKNEGLTFYPIDRYNRTNTAKCPKCGGAWKVVNGNSDTYFESCPFSNCNDSAVGCKEPLSASV